MRTLILSATLLTLIAAGPPKDKYVILTLKSGDSVEGIVVRVKKGRITIQTLLGRRELPEATVVARRPAAPVRERYFERKQDLSEDVAAHAVLMRWCKAQGFTSGVAAELDYILRRQPDHPGAWSLVKQLAPHYRLAKKNRHDPSKPRWARHEIDLLYAAAEKASFATAALLRAQAEAVPLEVQLNETIRLAERGTEPQRWVAAAMLGRSPDARRVRPLYRRALGDPSWQVRQEAVASLKKHDDGTTLGPLVKALLTNRHDKARVYAAEAMAMLGDKRAVPPLLTALAGSATGATRNHVTVTRQEAYIKDYDVEIAQAAVIADPIVDVVTEGVVLDVGVVSVSTQRRVYARSLNRLTGAGLGPDVSAWKEWWDANR